MNNMEKDVTNLWWSVSALEKDSYLVSHNNIIAEGRLGDYAYNPVLIDANRDKLYSFIEELDVDKNNLRFFDLLRKKDGSLWTEFHQKLDFMASMLMAANILEYEENPLDKSNQNPKVKILKK
jgi:hypothetical protein